MRILKYFFLRILLAFVFVTGFVATQKGEYEVVRSRFIKSPRAVVYTYVNDFRNWGNFMSWAKDDASVAFDFPAVTSGNGGSFSWKSTNAEGRVVFFISFSKLCIRMHLSLGAVTSEVYFTYEDLQGGGARYL